MTAKTVKLKIFRYNQGDSSPHFDTFETPANRWTTILTALQEIRRAEDPTLALRHSCHHASCGTCGMIVNGREVLACVTNALDEAAGGREIVVEPLKSLPILSDLTVDMTPFYGAYTTADMPYIRRSEHLPEAEPPDGIEAFTRYENCLECGLCVSTCPMTAPESAYLGPAALAAAWRTVAEQRGRDSQAVLDLVDNQHGCWRCHVAYECSEVCPSNVDPAGSIMALRQRLLRRKVGRFFGRSTA